MAIPKSANTRTQIQQENEDALTPDTVYELGSSLLEPDAVFGLDTAELSLYLVKQPYIPEWRHPSARSLVREARRSYHRYGDVRFFDSYDAKAAIYLVRTAYTTVAFDDSPTPTEEWLTIRFVPSDGEPSGSPDLDNCLCKGRPISEVVRSTLFDNRHDCPANIASISRMCGIPPYTVDGGPFGVGYRWLPRRRLRYSAPAFALINHCVLDVFGSSWRYLTGLAHPKVLSASFAVRTESGALLPTFTPAYERLGLATPREIRVDRSVEAYAYPGYFLNLHQLTVALRDLRKRGVVSEQTFQHYLENNPEQRAGGSEDGLHSPKWYHRLGVLLTTEGPIVGASMTGEALRSYLDQVVEDAPMLHIMETSTWKEEILLALKTVERKGRRRTYSGKPFLYDAVEAHRRRLVAYEQDGTAWVRNEDGKQRRVPPENQYDVTQATMFGLNERLTVSALSPVLSKEDTLRERFNREWERYTGALANAENSNFDYGVYAYYPTRNELVRYCPRFWHRIVAVASNSKLIADPECRLSWDDIQRIFANTTVAVAGASVGNNILHTVVMDMRPYHVKIADKSLFKMENINRVRLTYMDLVESNAKRTNPIEPLLRNKAIVAAVQLYAMDPYLTVHVYEEGITEENIARFLSGDDEEPAADIVVDEVDDPRAKLQLRKEARARRVPLIMLTDIGSSVQLDVLRYDLDPNLPLTYGTADEALYKALEAVENRPSDRDVFFTFADALVGPDYRQGELKEILEGRSEVPTATIVPQLGSTATMAGAIAAETIARIRLGEVYPPRVLVNKHTFEVLVYT